MEILNTIRSALVAMVFTGSVLMAAGSNPRSFFNEGKVCAGSNTKLHTAGNALDRYNSYLAKYENCTTVEDNLEIVFLEGAETYDMSFLESIRVVNGYVLIYGNVFETLPLRNLRLIRGRSLYTAIGSNESYSLYVAGNYKHNAGTKNVGLKEIHLTSLYEILEGDVLFERNDVLCYVKTINWTDILPSTSRVTFKSSPEDQNKRACGQCHGDCTGKCWGPTADLCQRINRLECASNCERSCFGREATQCCHQECAGGCKDDRHNCWLCRRLSNDGECVDRCPDEKIYNIKTMRYETNPNARYIYGANCVRECPSHRLIEAGACVSKCFEGSVAGDDGKCKKCENGVCPKTCIVTAEESYVGVYNVSRFEGCTVIEGHLTFLPNTFQAITNVTELNVFENVREITDYLIVQGDNIDFPSLSFLRNLRIVHGRTLSGRSSSVVIVLTNLKGLGLSSLREVSHGNIVIGNNSRLQNLGLVSLENVGKGSVHIVNNPQLCYVDTINWTQIVKSNRTVVRNCASRTEYCEPNGFVCSTECASGHGCWGKTDDDCRLCVNYRFGQTCVGNCTFRNDLYPVVINGSKECRRCDVQCLDGCTGEGPDKCLACRNVKDGINCLENCPPMKFVNATGGCEPCYELCKGGCSGKGNHLGPGGCSDCHLMKDLENGRNVCLGDDYICPENFYTYFYPFRSDHTRNTTISVKRCSPCNPECRTCYNSGTSKTKDGCVCRNFLYDDHCVSSCHPAHYYDDVDRHCLKCHHECSECHGPQASDCSVCKNYRLYEAEILVDANDYNPDNQSVYRPSVNTSKDVFLDDNNRNLSDSTQSLPTGAFNCTGVCPDLFDGKKKFTLGAHSQTVCVVNPPKSDSLSWEQKKASIVLPVVVCVIVLGVVAVLVIFLKRQLAKSEENKLRITARINGLDVEEIITPTDVKPDVSVLRLIKESELRRGNVIGSGAFGTVFKGIWIPTAENVKIPVAIKVLTESSNASLNVELLEEARIMASVNHTCCIRIIAVCMTSQMMLVTPLMPHGSLLDYVRKNRSSIGSSALLKWSAQIAKGMKYLEERGIVHRDLAARNVLVQGPGQVRITDFGLAKLLNYNEEQYKATGGKVPIKWLALESIRHCIFTHKSDVWSYGVTLWELFTYGERPYEGIKAVDMVRHLEMGERLSQPAICTIDVYMIMIKCWMIDADSRPTFCDLETDFTKMTQDPGRYLVILGDRFMRLQSVVEDVNTTDWFRALSMPEEEGPEKLVTADEYLRPQDLEGSHPFGHGCLQNMTSISEENNYENSGNRASSLDTSSTSSQTEDFKFVDLERAAAAKKLNSSSSIKGRYCKQNTRQTSDPGQGDEKVNAAGAKIGTPEKDSGANELKAMFSTDESDYLEPRSSALLSDGPNYLVVVDDSAVPQDKQSQSPTDIVENPEYLLQNDLCSNSPSEKDSLTQDVSRDQKHAQRLSDNYSYMRMA